MIFKSLASTVVARMSTLLVLCAAAATCLLMPDLARADLNFTAGDFPVLPSDEQEGSAVFSLEGGDATCSMDLSIATVEEPTQAITAAATFSGCTAFGFMSATVDAEECEFVLNAGEQTGDDEFFGPVDLVCPESSSVKITAATCAVEIGGQEGLSTAEYANAVEEAPAHMALSLNLTELAYTVTADGFLCPFNGTGEREDGEFTDSALLTGENEAEEAVGFFLAAAEVFPRRIKFKGANETINGVLEFRGEGEYEVVSQSLAMKEKAKAGQFELEQSSKVPCPEEVVIEKPEGAAACGFKIKSVGAETNVEATLYTVWRYAGSPFSPTIATRVYFP